MKTNYVYVLDKVDNYVLVKYSGGTTGLIISLKRTVQVSDNEYSEPLLPPSLGSFPLFIVNDFIDKLPKNIASKGGTADANSINRLTTLQSAKLYR